MNQEAICPDCGKPLPDNAPHGMCPDCLIRLGLGTNAEIGDDTEHVYAKAKGFVPPSVEEIARFFPQLEIESLLGRGGMGAVYKARQTELDRTIALKILPPGLKEDPAFAERFKREAQALAKLHHSHIVTLFEFGQVDGLFYFFMEYVDGVNLRQLLDNGRVSPREALAIVPQICEALQYAHDRGIVHRDIKPENILLNQRGQVKIADFGVARIMEMVQDNSGADRAAHGSTTESGRVVGTPQYMAPEQAFAPGEVDHRADIYSLGVVFYQMLTGQVPQGNIEPPSRHVTIDVRLDEIVMRALERKPELRYQHARDIQTEVQTMTAEFERMSEHGKGNAGVSEGEAVTNFPSNHAGKGKGSLIAGVAALVVLGAMLVAPLGILERLILLFVAIGLGMFAALLRKNHRVTAPVQLERPRLSKCAITGFLLAVVSITVTLIFLKIGTFPPRLATAIKLILLLTGFAVFSAASAATILGWVAVRRINRSGGSIYGMGLAMFDALLFPMLLVAAAVWLVVLVAITRYTGPAHAGSTDILRKFLNEFQTEIVVGVTLAILSVLSLLILGRLVMVLRKANANRLSGESSVVRATLLYPLLVSGLTAIAVWGLSASIFNINEYIYSGSTQRLVSCLLWGIVAAAATILVCWRGSKTAPLTSSGVTLSLLFWIAAVCVWLAKPHERDMIFKGTVTDTNTKLPVSEAVVYAVHGPSLLRTGFDNKRFSLTSDQVLARTYTDSSGHYRMPLPASKLYSLSDNVSNAVQIVLLVTRSGYDQLVELNPLCQESNEPYIINNFRLETKTRTSSYVSPSVEFQSGVKAKLYGVATNPRQGGPWDARGDVLPDFPRPFHNMVLPTFAVPKGMIAREFYLHISDLPTSDPIGFRFQGTGHHITANESQMLEVRRQNHYGITALFPDHLTSTSLIIGITSGKWRTFVEGPITTTTGFTQDVATSGVRHTVKLSAPQHVGGKLHVSVADTATETEHRLILTDSQGNKYTGTIADRSTLQNSRSTKFLFREVSPSVEIAFCEFQVRDYEWREFENVQLQPTYAVGNSREKISSPTQQNHRSVSDDLDESTDYIMLSDLARRLRRLDPTARVEWEERLHITFKGHEFAASFTEGDFEVNGVKVPGVKPLQSRPGNKIYAPLDMVEIIEKSHGDSVDPITSNSTATMDTSGSLAYQSSEPYLPPDFESYFANDEAGGLKLDALWKDPKKDSRPDEEIYDTVQQGLRHSRERGEVLRWFGNKYIWNKSPQNPRAIEIMYHAAETKPENLDPYGTRGTALYFGLSVVKEKTPAILRTLADLAMLVDDPNDLSRIAWGTESQQSELLKYIEPYLSENDTTITSKAEIVRKIITGELKAFEWASTVAAEKAQRNYADQLPAIRQALTTGTSAQRKVALDLILQERLTLIMDDTFITAFTAALKDIDPTIRREVARTAGEHWVWSAKAQNAEAINLMLDLSKDEDRQVRYNAVYFGLSTVRGKDETVVRRLLELAMDDREPNNYQRIIWGLKGDRDLAKSLLLTYILASGTQKAKQASEIFTDVTGEFLPVKQDSGSSTTIDTSSIVHLPNLK